MSQVPGQDGGAVTLVVIPDVRYQSTLNPLEPRASFAKLSAIQEYLTQHTPPFVRIQVLNPLFERIHITAQVRFRPGYDDGHERRRRGDEHRHERQHRRAQHRLER